MPTDWSTSTEENKDLINLQGSEEIKNNPLKVNQMVITRTIWSTVR